MFWILEEMVGKVMNRLLVVTLVVVLANTAVGCVAPANAAKGPAITSISPSSVIAGGPGFTLTVNGSNFNGNSNVLWNGAQRPTVTINSTQLQAFISNTDIATVGTVQVTVVDPKPFPRQSNPTSLTINSVSLTITTASLPTATVQQPYSADIRNSGGAAPYTWKIASGQLPQGLALDSTSGAINGAPGQIGKYAFTAQVSDSSSTPQTASQTLAVSVIAPSPLLIGTTTLPNGTVQVAYSATLAASGGVAPYSWSVVSGSLPPGLTLSASTGALSGAPSASGSYSFSVQVRDSAAATPQSATQGFTISVAAAAVAALQITTSSLPSGQLQVAYSATLAATGGTTPYSWGVVSGSFPPGLTLGASSGVISGTPTQAGQFGFIVQVKDSATQSARQALSIAIATQSSGSPAPGPNDTIIFQDGFEGGSLSQWYIDGTNSGKFAVVSSPVHSGSHSLQAIPDGTATKLAKWYLPGYDEVYTKFYVQFASSFVYSGHMFVVAGNQTSNQWSSFGQAGIRPSGTDYFYSGIDPEFYDEQGGTPGLYPFQFYTYWPQMSCPSDYKPPTVTDCWGNTTTQTAPAVANTTGVWHEVVHHIKLNTIGNSDGLQELWIDGQKKISQTGMQWRTSTILEVNMFAIEFFMSPSPSTEYAWVDDVQVWTPAASGFVYNNPAPTVSSVSPNTGPTAGGTSVSITGANFLAGALVFFGGVPASGVVVNSATQIQAVTPATTAGVVDVTVQNPDSQSANLVRGFTYTAPAPVVSPTITSVSPNSGSLLAGVTPASFTGLAGWTTVLTDGFESGGFSNWGSTDFVGGPTWPPASSGPTGGTGIWIDSNTVHSGSRSAGIHYSTPRSISGEIDTDAYLAKEIANPGITHIYISGYVFFHNSGTDVFTTDVNGIGRKLIYLKSLASSGSQTYLTVLSVRSNPGEANYGQPGHLELLVSDQSGTLSVIYYSSTVLFWDTWYQVELEVQESTPGATDGFFNVFVNGNLVLKAANIETRPSGTQFSNGLNEVDIGNQVNRFDSVNIDEYRYWDDIIILKK
jgi:hypothetical protein